MRQRNRSLKFLRYLTLKDLLMEPNQKWYTIVNGKNNFSIYECEIEWSGFFDLQTSCFWRVCEETPTHMKITRSRRKVHSPTYFLSFYQPILLTNRNTNDMRYPSITQNAQQKHSKTKEQRSNCSYSSQYKDFKTEQI